MQMDSEIIILSDDDDDDGRMTNVAESPPRMPPPPPRAIKSDPPSKTTAAASAADRPCPKSKKKSYESPHGHGAGDSDVRARPSTSVSAGAAAAKYPPPYPTVPRHAAKQPSWLDVPPAPSLTFVGSGADGSVELAWKMTGTAWLRRWAEVRAYELYVCRETDAPPDTSMWRMVDVIDGHPLPEGCVLINCPPGVHHIALRAIDVHDRRAPFSRLVVKI